ncbi:response regulator [Patescibacteria group bacterium]|nr:response regulator [Patescibacteria group bacterium]
MSEEEKKIEQKEEESGEKKIKIFIGEDDKFISRAYQDGLKRAGFEVFTGFDGSEVLKNIKENKPDLILLDLIMPIKNGFEVLGEMKMDSGLRKIPVVVLSNLGQDSDIERARELGAKDYLIKSNYSMKEIVEKVREYLIKYKIIV